MSSSAKTTDLAVRNAANKAVSASTPKPKSSKRSQPAAHQSPTQKASATAKRDRKKGEKGPAQQDRQINNSNGVATPRKNDRVVQSTETTTPTKAGKDGEQKKRKQKAGEVFKGSQERKQGKNSRKGPAWRLSPYLGGRYLSIDPVFSRDEKHLFLAHSNSLKVFSTKTSLLVRALVTASPKHGTKPESIVAYFLNPRDDNQIFVATSHSRFYLWDWTSGQQLFAWNLKMPSLYAATVCTDEDLAPDGEAKAVVYVASGRTVGSGGTVWRVRLLDSEKDVEKSKVLETNELVEVVQIHDSGRLVCAISGKELITLCKNAGNEAQWDEPRRISLTSSLTCMDVHTHPARPGKEKKSKKGDERRTVDVVVGDKMGVLHTIHDITSKKKEPVVRKLHWHRKAVNSVKWQLNGTYIISGGLETVIVLWQLDTNTKQFLPNLGSAIDRIVVSPKGASFAISLADNSVMVLSVSEFKPTANIAGIQTVVQDPTQKPYRIPCVLRPDKASNLLLVTPSEQIGRGAARPYLQTFDTFSDRHISRQALARTNATNLNQGPDYSKITEPSILHLAISSSGEWLASVDEWRPRGPKFSIPGSTEEVRGREIFLKFWRWSEKKDDWDLITRIDAPHPIPGQLNPGQVLALEAAPQGDAFITVGSDGTARVWKPKTRTRAGVPVRSGEGELLNWGCRRVMSFSKGKVEGELPPLALLDDPEFPSVGPHSKGWWSSAALSEDGSVLAIAVPASELQSTIDDSVIHLIDSETGVITQSLAGLRIGPVNGLAIVGRSLVVLGTSKLLVWNLVDGAVDWEYELQDFGAATSTSTYLAVDTLSGTFAISFTAPPRDHNIVIFKASEPEPLHIETLIYPVAALLTAGGGKGYMFLDSQARVQYLSPNHAPHLSLALATKGQIKIEEEESRLSEAYRVVGPANKAEAAGTALASGITNYEEDDEDSVIDRVVPREALENIFDEVPAYAAGPMEESFDRVLELFAKKALGDSEEEEEEEEEEEDGDSDEEMVD